MYTQSGTLVELNIDGRTGNCCPGFVNSKNLLGSPPDIEANVSPIEYDSKGTVVVDGSIACEEIGLLKNDIILNIKAGKIISFESEDNELVSICKTLFESVNDEDAYC